MYHKFCLPNVFRPINYFELNKNMHKQDTRKNYVTAINKKIGKRSIKHKYYFSLEQITQHIKKCSFKNSTRRLKLFWQSTVTTTVVYCHALYCNAVINDDTIFGYMSRLICLQSRAYLDAVCSVFHFLPFVSFLSFAFCVTVIIIKVVSKRDKERPARRLRALALLVTCHTIILSLLCFITALHWLYGD